jgi:undecaprenyl-phosphate galactose phosphotransferase
MQDTYSKAEAIEFKSIFKDQDKYPSISIKRRFFWYQYALIGYDIIVVILAFVLATWIVGSRVYLGFNLIQYLVLSLVSFTAIAFYQTFNLYNYHLIYLIKYHFINLLKSFGLSLLTYGFIAVIYVWPPVFVDLYLIPVIFLIAIGVVVLSRYLWDQMVVLLKCAGIGFLSIGIAGLVSIEEKPILMTHGTIILVTFVLTIGLILVTRLFLVHVVFNNWLRYSFRRQVVIIGSNEEANNIGRHVIKSDAPFWIAGVIGVTDIEVFLDIGIEKCFLGSLNELPGIVNKNKICEIIVTDENIDKRTLISFLDYCTSKGVNAWFPPNLLPIIDVKLYIDNFCGRPLIRLCSQKNSWLFNKIKHFLDALMALPVVIVQLPLLLTIAVAIKIDSKGPVFYKAKAIGRNGKQFGMYKFRSMHVNNGHEIHKNYVTRLIKGDIGKVSNGGKPLKITDDPRVTRVGKILRKTSLDELPQLINVLKGEMSLVGPRPCLPYEYEVYKDWYKKRTFIRPGITGLWQVAGRSEVAFEDMILLDLYYIYNRSLTLDFNILYETFFAVLAKKGAY